MRGFRVKTHVILGLFTVFGGAACGAAGGPDLSGLYDVEAHTVNTTGCGLGSSVTDVTWFSVKPPPAGGDGFVAFSCAAPDATMCTATLGLSVDKPGGPGWTGVLDFATGGDGNVPCVLGHVTTTGSLAGDGLTVQFQKRTYELQDATLLGIYCTAQAAAQMGTSMPCVSSEDLSGLRR